MKIETNKFERRFVISDIHGCFYTFNNLLNIISFNKKDCLFILGDSINTGYKSKEVLDLLINMKKEDYSIFVLRGNHEQNILDIENDDFSYIHLMRKVSNLFDDNKKLIKLYRDFLISLPYYFELEDFLLVHAGFNFEKENIFEDKEYMLTYTSKQIDFNKTGKRRIIHGHTPTPETVIIEAVENQDTCIGIDNGCVHKFKKREIFENIGKLCCLELNTNHLYFQENIDIRN